MPTNKIGSLEAGQGLRRQEAQREGGWQAADPDARANYKIGSEMEPRRPGGAPQAGANPNKPSQKGRWNG